MSALFGSPVAEWLNFGPARQEGVFVANFAEHHIGNPFIRSLHGGIVGAVIEGTAEASLIEHFAASDVVKTIEVTSSSINYLRVTKDADLFCRCEIIRIGRRVAFVDIWCWQDHEDLPVAKGNCVLRIS